MRIIARLDIKNNILIKSIMFDGVKKLGDPEAFANEYYEKGIDELMLINNTGSLYNTKLNTNLVKKIRHKKLIPISAGGGISNYDDAIKLIDSGCDKIIINSIVHKNKLEAEKIINSLGSSSVVGSIQFEKRNNKFVTLYEMARETTSLTLYDTLKLYYELGIGEVLLTDVSRDGCYFGLSDQISEEISIYHDKMPILLSGGFSQVEEINIYNKYLSGVVISSSFHYRKLTIDNVIKYRDNYLK